jgi:hypothetical protein
LVLALPINVHAGVWHAQTEAVQKLRVRIDRRQAGVANTAPRNEVEVMGTLFCTSCQKPLGHMDTLPTGAYGDCDACRVVLKRNATKEREAHMPTKLTLTPNDREKTVTIETSWHGDTQVHLTVAQRSLFAEIANGIAAAERGELSTNDMVEWLKRALELAIIQYNRANIFDETITKMNSGENARLRALVDRYRQAMWAMHEQAEAAINADDWDATKGGA